MLLEILTDQDRPQNNGFLHRMIKKVADGSFVIRENLRESGCNGLVAANILNLALDCTKEAAGKRPSAIEIVRRLDAIGKSDKIAPLDLETESFYVVRRGLVDGLLDKIEQGMAEEILIMSWESHVGTACRGANWDKHSLS